MTTTRGTLRALPRPIRIMADFRLVIHLLLTALVVSAQSIPKVVASKKATPNASRVAPGEDWLVWGGKNRDFLVDSSGLADSWPVTGPKKIWSRALGDGYSAIAEESGILYTAFRRGSKDVVTALDASTGKTRWEYEYENPFTNSFSEKVGPGPYAMPQVVGDRVVAASGTGKIHSLDKKTGRPIWSHNLYTEFDGTQLQFGYSCHA
ncbi:MAG TPA: PQQ-binding-like beta-propeller repeat protein, partial [Candidatus Limnocylindrales bacterium]|nr:PQQ-binding-like beta-propeller repeat protein [Candidatus Limnocylindrales bacterium]